MKYVLLFCGDEQDAAAFEAMTPDELAARYAEVGAWFAEHQSKIGATNQLQRPACATSVRFGLEGPLAASVTRILDSRPRSSPAMPKPLAGRPPTGCRSCCSTTRCWPSSHHQ